MKKISTLLLSSLFSLAAFAIDGNRLSVSVVSNKMDLKIEIDGKKYSMQQDNSFTLQNLREGNHSVKIYTEKKKGGGVFRSGKKQQEILFNSSVYLKRGFHTDITVNRFGKVFTDERRIDANDEWDDDYGYDDQDQHEGWHKVINDDQFNFLKSELRKEWFESSRLTIAQTMMEDNFFTVAQVKELMYLFTFETNRVQIAKTAYRSTVDKENYYQLNDALTFSSSKEDLARFIRESR